MLDTTSVDIEECEGILIRHLTPVAADLKLLDLTRLLELVASDRMDNIASVVDGSCELYFKENTLSFFSVGEFEIDFGFGKLGAGPGSGEQRITGIRHAPPDFAGRRHIRATRSDESEW